MGSPAVMAIKIVGDSKDARKAFSGLEKRVHNFSKKFGAAGPLVKAGLIAGIAAIPAAAAAAGKALYDIGAEFDELTDTIRVGTGATGDALTGLVGDAKAVGAKVPAEFSKVGQTVADLNTRLGLSGTQLQDVAAQVLEAGRIMGQDIDISATTAAFNAFHLEADKISPAMDTLFRVSQDTGISMNELAGKVGDGAIQLQSLGFSFDQSAALIGKLDKAGLDTSKTLSGMTKGLTTLAKAGEEPAQAFHRVTGEIQQLVKQGKQGEALDISSKLFGTRGAPQFIQAIQNGAFALADLDKAAKGSGDTIMEAGRETMDAAEAWQILKNNTKLALEPLGSAVFQAVGEAFKALADVISGTNWDALKGAFNTPQFAAVANTAQTVWASLKRIGQAVADLAAAFIGHLGPALEWVQYAFEGAWTMVSGVVEGALTVIEGIITTFTAVLEGDWGAAWEGVQSISDGVWQMITSIIDGAVQYITGILAAFGTLALQIVTNAWNTVKGATGAAWDAVSSAVSSGITRAVTYVGQLPSRALAALGGISSYLYSAGADLIRGFINGIGSMASAVWDKVTGIASAATNAVKSALGIASPSRVFTEIGVQTGQGLIVGLNRMATPAARAARNLVTVPTPPRNAPGNIDQHRATSAAPVEIHLHGVIDKMSAAREIEALLRRYRRAGGVVTV